MRTKFIAPLVTMALFGALMAGAGAPANAAPAAAATAAAAKAQAPKATITNSVLDVAGTAKLINGVSVGDLTDAKFTVAKFVKQDGKMMAAGTVTGMLNGQSVTTPATAEVKSANNSATPSAAAIAPEAVGLAATCQVLNLVLGPLHLNLLGLVVDLNQVVLNITAVQGALLGDLLCSVANLLNGGVGQGGSGISSLINLLNRLLGL